MTRARSVGSDLIRIGRALSAISAWPGQVVGWLLVPLAFMVIATVVGSLMQLGNIVQWGVDIPVLGTGLTLNSLNELQWHFLAVITMLALPYALVENRHVRVDLIYATRSRRQQNLIDLAGDIFLLLPFCLVVGYLSINFVTFAYRTGEQSTYGGLVDRWMIKAFVPLGLGLLLTAATGRILSGIGTLMVQGRELDND